MKVLKYALFMFGFAVLLASPVLATVSTQAVSAKAKTAADCERPFLTLPTWYRGLSKLDADGTCSIASPGGTNSKGNKIDLAGFIWKIALNVIDIGLQAVGYIAFFFIMYGGFQFLTGGSNPGQIEKARKTILNAVIGLVISFAAVAIINLIFGILG